MIPRIPYPRAPQGEKRKIMQFDHFVNAEINRKRGLFDPGCGQKGKVCRRFRGILRGYLERKLKTLRASRLSKRRICNILGKV